MSLSKKRQDVIATEVTANDNSELDEYLTVLRAKLPVQGKANNIDVQSKVTACHAIRQLLLDRSEARDTFRHLSGFEIVLEALGSLNELFAYDEPDQGLPPNLFHLLDVIFSTLAGALGEHRGNRKYFERRIRHGGWESLKLKLSALRRAIVDHAPETLRTAEQHIIGCLFACAINDETVLKLFQTTGSEEKADRILPDNPQSEITDVGESLTGRFKMKLDQILGTAVHLQHPESLSAAFDLWLDWQHETAISSQTGNELLVEAICYLARLNNHNLIALHRTHLLSNVLSALTNIKRANSASNELHELATLLLSLGITKLDDAHFLFSSARVSSSAADLLLHALQSSHSPSYFQFDLSVCGYSSIELPDIGTTLPPTGSSNGYTLSLWLQIEKFDTNAHTTLFGAFDSSQTCFVLVYLEKDSHNLILQTSVTSSRPSVRFKSISFREARWYHIALTHRRPKVTSSSRVSLFVNGEFVEQVKSNYPLAPHSPRSKSGSANHVPSSHGSSPIQAFVGTPQDLASRLGKGVVSSRWRLASAYLFGDVLSDDLIAVHYELGPRYYGNYQDRLGSFNTYQAAASLKIRNDNLHSGKQQHSDIIRAMESGASDLFPERKISLALSPWNALGSDDFGSPEESHVTKFLSKTAAKTAKNISHNGHEYLVINGTTPTFNGALRSPNGFALPTGEPAISKARSLDDAAWQIGGCTGIVLDHLENSDDHEATLKALSCIFESIRDNWRCSEAMEKDNGFAILSSLISQKIDAGTQRNDDSGGSSIIDQGDEEDKGEFPFKILSMILRFLGFRPDKPEDSVLNNPLAYRVLIVDADYWRSMASAVQKLYYEQFDIFGARSKYHTFNAKRLSKMRIIKKWLDALKTDPFEVASFDSFLTAFRSMLGINMAADHLRSLAMYITYAVEQGQKEEEYVRSQTHRNSASRSPVQSFNPVLNASKIARGNHRATDLSTSQIAVRLLELYADLVCLPGDTANIVKFTKTVTNKVCQDFTKDAIG
ncbi:MAG: hypothetical protein Q9166_002235 [cf. Caloplaca sp. 2 TL-2023]